MNPATRAATIPRTTRSGSGGPSEAGVGGMRRA